MVVGGSGACVCVVEQRVQRYERVGVCRLYIRHDQQLTFHGRKRHERVATVDAVDAVAVLDVASAVLVVGSAFATRADGESSVRRRRSALSRCARTLRLRSRSTPRRAPRSLSAVPQSA